MRRLLLAACLAAAAAPARAAGTNSAEFLRLGMGAPSALAEAGGSVDEGPTALFWNPAGLLGRPRREAYASNLGLPQGVNANYLGATLPVAAGWGGGVAGASLQVLTQEPVDRYNNIGQNTGRFTADGLALAGGYAREWNGWRAGAALRLIRESVDGSYGMSGALDLGVQRRFGRVRAGAAATNLGPGLAVGGLAAPLPATLRLGASCPLVDGLSAAFDLSRSEGRGVRAHLGARARLWGPLSAALGYAAGGGSEYGPIGVSSGIGLEGEKFRADFAYRDYGAFGAALQVGIGARF